MNTVMTLNKKSYSVNLTHRNDEFRIVLKSKDETIISRLSITEVNSVKKNEITKIKNTNTYPIQHAKIVNETIFNFEDKNLKLIIGNELVKISFTSVEWYQMIDYMVNGVEGRVLI